MEKVSPVAVIVPLTTICRRRSTSTAHRVAGGEAQRPAVGERLAGRQHHGYARPHDQRRPRGHRETAGEDVLQVRRVGADRVECQRLPLGSVSAIDVDLLERWRCRRGTARRRRARRSGMLKVSPVRSPLFVDAAVVQRELAEVEGAAGRLELAAGVDLDRCAAAVGW